MRLFLATSMRVWVEGAMLLVDLLKEFEGEVENCLESVLCLRRRDVERGARRGVDIVAALRRVPRLRVDMESNRRGVELDARAIVNDECQ